MDNYIILFCFQATGKVEKGATHHGRVMATGVFNPPPPQPPPTSKEENNPATPVLDHTRTILASLPANSNMPVPVQAAPSREPELNSTVTLLATLQVL